VIAKLGHRNLAILLSILLFAVALTQTAFLLGAEARPSASAGRLLLQGWRGLGHGYVEWLANPVMLAGWLLAITGQRRLAAAAALAALALMLVFACRVMLNMPLAGHTSAVTSLRAGYWLWVGSALTLSASNGRYLHEAARRYISGPTTP